MATRFKVGAECSAWCTKCKAIQNHSIVAMVAKLPKRVECLTCKSQHNYRAEAPSPKKKAAKKKAKTTRKPVRRRKVDWNALVGEQDQSEARAYKLSATFEADELIDHSMFGMGIVLEAKPGNKIEVLFEEGQKLLVHSR